MVTAPRRLSRAPRSFPALSHPSVRLSVGATGRESGAPPRASVAAGALPEGGEVGVVVVVAGIFGEFAAAGAWRICVSRACGRRYGMFPSVVGFCVPSCPVFCGGSEVEGQGGRDFRIAVREASVVGGSREASPGPGVLLPLPMGCDTMYLRGLWVVIVGPCQESSMDTGIEVL